MVHPIIIPTKIFTPLSYGDHRMSSNTDEDSQQRFALGFLFALIALVVFSVVGFATYRYGLPHASAKAAATTTAADAPAQLAVVTETVTVIIPDGASIQTGADGQVNFYFATGSADLAPGAAEALVAVIKGVEAGRKAIVSGYHDTTGDAAINEALAKKRAETVRDVLVGLGVPADKVTLEKPAETTASGSNAAARRVEVKLVD